MNDIEKRLDDSCCTIDFLKTDNQKIISGFQKSGEQVVLIDSDYEQATAALLV